MINGIDVESFFDQNAKKRSFSELSLNKHNNQPLVNCEKKGYDYEELVMVTLKQSSFKMVDSVFIKDDKIYFIEFKGGFIQKINTNTFDHTKWRCEYDNRYCKDGAEFFKENQKLKISQLIESVKGKLLETYLVFNRIIIPQCANDSKSYKVYYVAVIDDTEAPIFSIENNLNDLADLKPNQNSPKQRLIESLKKYDVTDSEKQPLFFDYIEVWSNYEFLERICSIS